MQYANMTGEGIQEALRRRRDEGYPGGMPPGAKIDEYEAIKRFNAGEVHYLKEVDRG